MERGDSEGRFRVAGREAVTICGRGGVRNVRHPVIEGYPSSRGPAFRDLRVRVPVRPRRQRRTRFVATARCKREFRLPSLATDRGRPTVLRGSSGSRSRSCLAGCPFLRFSRPFLALAGWQTASHPSKEREAREGPFRGRGRRSGSSGRDAPPASSHPAP